MSPPLTVMALGLVLAGLSMGLSALNLREQTIIIATVGLC